MAHFTMGTGGHCITMLPADWSIFTSHDPLPSSFHSKKMLWNPSILLSYVCLFYFMCRSARRMPILPERSAITPAGLAVGWMRVFWCLSTFWWQPYPLPDTHVQCTYYRDLTSILKTALCPLPPFSAKGNSLPWVTGCRPSRESWNVAEHATLNRSSSALIIGLAVAYQLYESAENIGIWRSANIYW